MGPFLWRFALTYYNHKKGEKERMGITELFVLAIGLSMDAFAVSVCKGLSLGRINAKHMCIAGAWFGGFQALMPLLGYLHIRLPDIVIG